MNSKKTVIHTSASELMLKRPSRRDMLEYTPQKKRIFGDDFDCFDDCFDTVNLPPHVEHHHLPNKTTKRRPNRSDMLELVI